MKGVLFCTAFLPAIFYSQIAYCFISNLSKKSGQFLAFFDLRLVKNFSKLIKAVLGITIQVFKILLLVPFIPDFDFTFRNSCLGYAFSIIFSTYTNVRRYTSIFFLSILRCIDIDTNTSSFIIRFVFNIFIGQCTCGDFIFVFFSFTGDNTAFEVGIFTYVNIKPFFACVNTALVCYAIVVAVNFTNACTAANCFITAKTNTRANRFIAFFVIVAVLLVFIYSYSRFNLSSSSSINFTCLLSHSSLLK